MSGDPSISVILPTYNRADLVPRAIESVLDQTFEDFELIVVDDGSTDETKQVVDRIDDPRIEYIRHEENQGGAAARNTGIEAATGEYLAFLDDDDEWLPRKLELQRRRMEETDEDVAIIYCQYHKYSDLSDRVKRNILQKQWEGDVYEKVLSGWSPPTSVLLVRKNTVEVAGGFDRDLPSYQDYDLLIRLAKSHEFRAIEAPLAIKHIPTGTQNTTEPAIRKEGFDRIMQKWADEIRSELSPEELERFRRHHEAYIHWLYAIQTIDKQGWEKSMSHLKKSMGFCPNTPQIKRIGGYIALLVGGDALYRHISSLYQYVTWSRPDRYD